MSRRKAPSHGDRHRSKGTPLASGNPTRNNAVSLAPPPLKAGQLRCPACRNGVKPTTAGLRKHRDLFGNDCWNRARADREVVRIVAPPVNLGRGADTNHQPPDGHCQECSKPIPPMRRLCGRCNARRVLP